MASSSAVVQDATGPSAAELINLRTDILNGPEMWIPVSRVGEDLKNYGDFPVRRLDASGDEAFISFYVPSGYSAISKAVIVGIAKASQASANWDIESDYGAKGELHTNHSESDTATTYNATNDKIIEVDISGILSSVAAGDYVGIQLTEATSGHDLDVLGIRFAWTTVSTAVVQYTLSDRSDYNELRQDVLNSRELWQAAYIGSGAAHLISNRGDFPVVKLVDTGDAAYIHFYAPAGFKNIIDAVIVIIPVITNASGNYDITTDFGAEPESRTQNSGSDTASTYSVTINELEEIDFKSTLSGIAAGDWVGVKIALGDTNDIDVVGVRIKWTDTENSGTVRNGLDNPATQYNNLLTDALVTRHRTFSFHSAGATGSALSAIGDFPAVILTAIGHEALVSCIAPTGYASIDAIVVMFTEADTTPINMDLETDFAGNTETYNNSGEEILAFNFNSTDDIIRELGFATMLTGLAAGDYIGLKLTLQSTKTIRIIGVRFEWT